MISKNKIFAFFLAGFVIQVVLVLFSYSTLFESCYDNLPCRESFLNWVRIFSPYLHLFTPIFFLSLITYWMREEVYKAWFRFARWWIPLLMLAIFIAPEYSGDWLYPIEKGGVALIGSLFFCVISVLIIGVKYVRSGR